MIWKAIAVTLLGVALTSGHAISEQKVVKYFRGHHGQLSHIGEKPEHHEEYAWAYPAYEFAYKVEDPHTHDFKGQVESRDGDVVKGEYWLMQPDGRKRIVKYHADKHSGFKADVIYEGVAHHPQTEVKHNIPHKPHVEHKIVVEHKPEIKLERHEPEPKRREPERREPERWEEEKREPERWEPERREEKPKVTKISQKIIHVIPKKEKHEEPKHEKQVRIVHWPRHESREREEEEKEREVRREPQREEEEERIRIPYYGNRRHYRHTKSQE